MTIPNKAVTVEVAFIEPPRTKISFTVALLGWTMTFGLLIIGFIKSKFIKNEI